MYNRSFLNLIKSGRLWINVDKNLYSINSNQLLRSISKCSTNYNKINSSDNNEEKDNVFVYESISPNLNPSTSHSNNKSHFDDKDKTFNCQVQSDKSFGDYVDKSNQTENQLNNQNIQLQNDFNFKLDNFNKSIDILRDLPPVDLDPNSKIMEPDYIRTIRPELQPTFNLAAYADRMDIIRQLVKLNVKLYEIEKDRELTQFLITLNFDKNVIPYLNFLIKCGFRRKDLGPFLTKNFKILQENIENLEKRVAYYRRMEFPESEILKMMINNPQLINYSIEHVDTLLGNIQRYLKIKPCYIRKMLVDCSKIIRLNNIRMTLEEKNFALLEQCGFGSNQVKTILVNNSKLLFRDNLRIVGSFDYVYDNITKDYGLIIKFCDILSVNRKILEERHLYLKSLNRAQYDPLKPLYVPLYAFVIDEDEFLKQFCKTESSDFYKFIKTM